MSIIKDKEEGLTIGQMLKGAIENRKLDRYSIALKLFDKPLLWYHTSIQNAQHLDRIIQMRTFVNLGERLFDDVMDTLNDEEKQELNDLNEQVRKTFLAVTEDYAELRKSAKGFTAKQIEAILSGEAKSDKDLDKIFKKREQEIK